VGHETKIHQECHPILVPDYPLPTWRAPSIPKFMRQTLLRKLLKPVLHLIALELACRVVPTVLKNPLAKIQNLRNLRMPNGEKVFELNIFRTHLPDKTVVVDWAVEVGCVTGKESPM
jgi:hypothetical protein